MAYKPVQSQEKDLLPGYTYGNSVQTPVVTPQQGGTPQSAGYSPINFSPVNVYQPGQTYDSFFGTAQNRYTPIYNEKVAALKNALAQNLAALEGQKLGINQNYDSQVKNQNMANTRSKNNYSNSMLGRGLGRSSIATTGLSEQDMINNRMVNDINTYRTSALGNVDAQKTAMETGANNEIAQMGSDLQTQIANLAQTLFDEYQKNLYGQATFNAQGQLDTDKFNKSGQMDYDKFEYGKTQDATKNQQWQSEFDLDKWYKEQMVGIQKQELAASAAKNNYTSPNGYGTDATAKEYDQAFATAKYVYASNRPMADKLADLQSIYTQAKAERNPNADKLAANVLQMLNNLKMQASYDARDRIQTVNAPPTAQIKASSQPSLFQQVLQNTLQQFLNHK